MRNCQTGVEIKTFLSFRLQAAAYSRLHAPRTDLICFIDSDPPMTRVVTFIIRCRVLANSKRPEYLLFGLLNAVLVQLFDCLRRDVKNSYSAWQRKCAKSRWQGV